jgi:ubiquinone/menaquinone biosynthesis C-methylase UbiE
VQAHLQDATQLQFGTATFDAALLFFLLHEMPEPVRRATLAQAWRAIRPGGTLIMVDYHRPVAWHPLKWPMRGVFASLEPYAPDLWAHEVAHWLPTGAHGSPPPATSKTCYFGGLYQLVVFTR